MATDIKPIINVSGLTNRFGTQVVHDHLDLQVCRDEVLAVVGGSGTGKSVLLRSILGLHRPNGGHIEVLGQKIRYQEPGPHKRWGVLFQGGALISGLTVQENVELPIALYSDMPVETRHELASLKLLMVGLSLSVADKYPSELSGGMRKRVALARALMNEPDVIFADEPTGNLDSKTGDKVLHYLFQLVKTRGHTLVLVTHSRDVASRCSRQLVLKDGCLI